MENCSSKFPRSSKEIMRSNNLKRIYSRRFKFRPQESLCESLTFRISLPPCIFGVECLFQWPEPSLDLVQQVRLVTSRHTDHELSSPLRICRGKPSVRCTGISKVGASYLTNCSYNTSNVRVGALGAFLFVMGALAYIHSSSDRKLPPGPRGLPLLGNVLEVPTEVK